MKLTLFGIFFILHISLAAKPWEPSAGSGNWTQTHQTLLQTTTAHKSQIKVVFVGDSITNGWAWGGWGLDIWNKDYAPRGAYNYGIAGDTTSNVIWRIQNGEFNGLDTKVAVVMIGTNNIGRDPDSDIAKGIKEVVLELEKKMPNAKIILLGILPRQGVSADTSAENINKQIAVSTDSKVHYLDFGSHFRASLGNVNTTLYRDDHLHINAAGYTLWHELMESLFSQLLSE